MHRTVVVVATTIAQTGPSFFLLLLLSLSCPTIYGIVLDEIKPELTTIHHQYPPSVVASDVIARTGFGSNISTSTTAIIIGEALKMFAARKSITTGRWWESNSQYSIWETEISSGFGQGTTTGWHRMRCVLRTGVSNADFATQSHTLYKE